MRRYWMPAAIILLAVGLVIFGFVYAVFSRSETGSAPEVLPTQAVLPDSPAPELAEGALPELSGEWQISLSQTGGIMGVSRSMELSNDAEMRVLDSRSNARAMSLLPERKMTELADLVANTRYQAAGGRLKSCADCYIFELTIVSGQGKEFRVQVDEVNLPDSGLQPLVVYLAALMGAAVK